MEQNENVSPEEIEVNKILDETDRQVEEIENQIKNLPKDKPPMPRLNLRGSPLVGGPGTQAQNKAVLHTRIETSKLEAGKKIDQIRDQVSPDKRKEIDALITKRQEEKLKNQSRSEVENNRDIFASQEVMNEKLGKPKTDKLAKDHSNAKPQEKNEISMSTKFSAGLGFTALKQTSPDVDKTENEMDRQTGSMSQRFNQTLGESVYERQTIPEINNGPDIGED